MNLKIHWRTKSSKNSSERMKSFCIHLLFVVLSFSGFAQTIKVAILDFENTSGKEEYDALGKAMSSMLITDLSNHIHPNKVEFFERSQLNKLLDEQQLQKSKSFDTKTAVDFGKLSGVDYVFLGSVFVMEGICSITSNLVDVQTSKIILSKEANGEIETWLQLKSRLAEAIAQQFDNPVTLDAGHKLQTTTLATLNQYAKVLSTMDEGNLDRAEEIRSLFEETNPEFTYFRNLKGEIEQLQIRISELENVATILTSAFELGDKAELKQDYQNAIKFFEKFLLNPGNEGYVENKKLYAYSKLANSQFKTGDYQNALLNAKKAQDIYKYFPEANEIELFSLIQLNEHHKAEDKYNFILDSLSFLSELNFRRNDYNPELNWESIDGLYFGLLPEENSETWVYLGLRGTGYGSSVENEVQIKKALHQNSLTLAHSKNQLSQYEKIEAKLLAFDDPLIFSSDQILNFYKLSLTYADELNSSGNNTKYKRHIEKEIMRMESFGMVDSIMHGRTGLSYSEQEPLRRALYDFGLGGNSWQKFQDDFHLIYGNFINRYLIQLCNEGQIKAAADLYRKISTTSVVDRRSYFYGFYWDIILGLRTIDEDWNSRFNLSEEDFEKEIDERIKRDLKKEGIPEEILDRVKSENIEIHSGSIDVEVDERFGSNESTWSKNLGIIEDGLGSEIKRATEETLQAYRRDSIPAYCFYDFYEANGEDYGKLYNYWALRLITENPPKGWRVASQKDYATFLGLDEIMLTESAADYENLLDMCRWPEILDVFQASGERHSNGFSGIEWSAHLWTADVSDDPTYHMVVEVLQEGDVMFSGINCKDCYFSIRLIKG